MKNLTIASVIDKNRIASDVAWVIALSIDVINPADRSYVETLRVVRNNEPVTIGGQSYTPFPFDIEIEEELGEISPISITIQDQTRTIQGYMQNYGGGIGFNVEMIIAPVPDATQNVDIDPELVMNFRVVGASSDDANYTAVWQLGAESPLSVIIPRRKQYRDRCAWQFKGPECAYIGPLTSCSRTLDSTNGCRDHDNVENYGGQPGIINR